MHFLLSNTYSLLPLYPLSQKESWILSTRATIFQWYHAMFSKRCILTFENLSFIHFGQFFSTLIIKSPADCVHKTLGSACLSEKSNLQNVTKENLTTFRYKLHFQVVELCVRFIVPGKIARGKRCPLPDMKVPSWMVDKSIQTESRAGINKKSYLNK